MHHIFITNALSIYMVVFNFAEDPVFLGLMARHCLAKLFEGDGSRVSLNLMACVMRARVRCFWHVKQQKVQCAILDGEDVHFRSFAQLALCGCAAMPDTPGITSRLMRMVLAQISPEHPLEIDLKEGKVTRL